MDPHCDCHAFAYTPGPARFTPPAFSLPGCYQPTLPDSDRVPPEMPPVDYALISHNHYDHLDISSVRALEARDAPIWLVPSGLGEWMRSKAGVDPNRLAELSWWSEAPLEVEGMRVACAPAHHWTSRHVWDRNASLWCSWAVISENERFFFAGDTAYAPIFKDIAKMYGPFDIAAIPIGAYTPRWFMKSQHCDPAEAVQIHKELQARRSFAIHWGAFNLTPDSHTQAALDFVDAHKAGGLRDDEFDILRHGEGISPGQPRRYACSYGLAETS